MADYLIVDDFESYTDDEGSRIFQTWIDGYGRRQQRAPRWAISTAPFAERTIVYSGSQAMPMDYNNTNSPWFSEAERTWATAQNWMFGDVNTLVVHFRGQVPGLPGVGPGRHHHQRRRLGHLA